MMLRHQKRLAVSAMEGRLLTFRTHRTALPWLSEGLPCAPMEKTKARG